MKRKFLVIPLPLNSYDIELDFDKTFYGYEKLGNVSDLKDKDCDCFVEYMFWDETPERKRFKNYFNPVIVSYPFLSSKESFISLLRSKGYILKESLKKPMGYDEWVNGDLDIRNGNETKEYFNYKELLKDSYDDFLILIENK